MYTAASDLGLHCLLRPVRPNTLGKYGILFTYRPILVVSIFSSAMVLQSLTAHST